MSSGGLMELVAYGAQDIYLTGSPNITFFKQTYRRHTNFAIEEWCGPEKQRNFFEKVCDLIGGYFWTDGETIREHHQKLNLNRELELELKKMRISVFMEVRDDLPGLVKELIRNNYE